LDLMGVTDQDQLRLRKVPEYREGHRFWAILGEPVR
jgi:hypothetical protein